MNINLRWDFRSIPRHRNRCDRGKAREGRLPVQWRPFPPSAGRAISDDGCWFAIPAAADIYQFMRNAPRATHMNIKKLFNEGRSVCRASDLMAQCDPNAPMPDDMKKWDQMLAVGLECEIEITEEDGVFVARCPNPEICSDGATEDEALMNLREAVDLYFRV